MRKHKLFCNLDKKLEETLIKNPHTIEYFCDVSNIDVNINKVNKNFGYYYEREFNPPLHNKNIKKDKQEKYKKDKLPLLLSDISNEHIYIPRKQTPSTVIHWGQMKLFLSTLHFLIKYCPKNKDVNILYAGSANGHNIPLLTRMFPNTNWYLVDPRDEFNKRLNSIKSVKKRIDYFTDEMAKELKEKMHEKFFLFISDIRLVRGNKLQEDDVDMDLKLQKEWVNILQPDYAQLKFRIPYDKKEIEYFEGDIYLQDYAKISSNEARMVVKKGAKIKKYTLKEYEGKMFYFNRFLRPSYYKHNYKMENIDHCYDCSKFMYLINEYNKYNSEFFKGKSIKKIVEFIIEDIKTINRLKIETEKILKNIKF